MRSSILEKGRSYMRRIRKMTTVLLAVCMVCMFYPVDVYAASAELRFSDPSTTVGAEVEVTATFTASASIQSMSATLTYDTNMLRFIEGNHVQDNGGSLSVTGGGDGMADTVTVTMKFQALAEGTTKIEVASSSGTDLNNSAMDVVNGSSTITIGPGDPSLIQQPATQQAGSGSVDVNGVMYTISSDFTDLIIPEGFERSELELDGAVYGAVKQTTSETKLAYLQPPEGDAEFFLYNPDNASFSMFEQVEIGTGRYLIFLDNTGGVKVPRDYLETTLSMADSNKQFPAWQNTKNPEYYLVYGLNSDGSKELYQYDTVDGSYQRYLNPDTGEEKDASPVGKLTDKLLGKLGNFMDFLIIAAAALILFLLFMLIVVSIKLRHRNLELDDLYDEYGIDLEEEEEAADSRADKKAKKGKKKKSEDDLYDFEDEDDEYDEYEDSDEDYEEEDYEEESFTEYQASDYEDDSEIDDLDALLNARVQAKKSAKRPKLQKVGSEPKKSGRQLGHAEEDDTFKMDLIDLD